MASKGWQEHLTGEVVFSFKRKLEGGREVFLCLGICRAGARTAATDSRHVTPLRGVKGIRNVAVKGTGKTGVV